jgi:hypothetical protein
MISTKYCNVRVITVVQITHKMVPEDSSIPHLPDCVSTKISPNSISVFVSYYAQYNLITRFVQKAPKMRVRSRSASVMLGVV